MTLSQEIIALERSALDRWIAFDPQGYLDLSAPEVTYFDPFRKKRVDGLEALKARLEPIKQFKGSITEPRYEMIDANSMTGDQTNPALPFIECEQIQAGLAVSDIAAAVDYYTKKLGFRHAFNWGEPPTFAGVNLGRVQMFLAKGTPTPNPETGAVYFLVGDADQLYEFHRANGVEIAEVIDDRPYGIRDYTVRDLIAALRRCCCIRMRVSGHIRKRLPLHSRTEEKARHRLRQSRQLSFCRKMNYTSRGRDATRQGAGPALVARD